MNYKESTQLLEVIRAAKRVFVTCHVHPDPDSVGSALATQLSLKQLGIDSSVICVDELQSTLHFLPHANTIVKCDIERFDFQKDDLVIVLDIGDWSMLFGTLPEKDPTFHFVRIDHHKTGTIKTDLTIVETTKSSTAEILYGVFQDWGISLTADIATCLLTGIVGDTGSFQYELTKASTHATAAALYEAGASHNDIYFHLFRTTQLGTYKLLGIFLKNMVLEREYSFVWTAVPFEEYTQIADAEKSPLMDVIIQTVDNTKFGMRITEKEKGKIDIAFRSRYPGEVDVSILAKKLGGGGHMAASGASIRGTYNDSLETILREAKTFAQSL